MSQLKYRLKFKKSKSTRVLDFILIEPFSILQEVISHRVARKQGRAYYEKNESFSLVLYRV